PEERQAVIGGLVRHNDAAASPAAYRELSVIARAEGEIVGGLLGWTNWNWLFIAQLWVAEAARGGTGRRLVTEAEQAATARGCTHAHVDTFGFQALPFYRKLGYELFGELEDYPRGETRYFLQKRNLTSGV
ncbi:MAG: GNAT family N-acetyltransferase, partial [Verrucomicrobiota bacterium]|nr:GNAT family N-acetyltransferase [Verrucomicrobiota bacterium]